MRHKFVKYAEMFRCRRAQHLQKKTTKIFFTGPRVVVFVAAVVLFLLSSNFSMNVFVSEQITPDNSHTKKGRWPVAIATDTS